MVDLSFTPAVQKKRRKLDAGTQRKFIAALARCGFVGDAAAEIGVSVAALHKLRYRDGAEAFRAAWDRARLCDTARDARRARRRGIVRVRDGGDGDDGSAGYRVIGGAERDEPLHCRSARPSRRTSHVAFTTEEPEPGDPLLDFAPFLHKQPRRNAITPDRQRRFIAVLAATGSVTQAARRIGASVEALYTLRARKGAEGFAGAWERAVDCGIARLEDTALTRAIEGEARPIVSGGAIIGEWRRHNEALVMFMLRHRRAHRYGEAAMPRPGDPVYETLKQQWRAETFGDEDAVRARINAKLDLMRERMEAGRHLLSPPPAQGR